jgi:hypothetical protein
VVPGDWAPTFWRIEGPEQVAVFLPSATKAVHCGECRDNGPFIRSSCLAQLADVPGCKERAALSFLKTRSVRIVIDLLSPANRKVIESDAGADQLSALPKLEVVKTALIDSLVSGQLMITKVNSDKDIKELLADDGQLKLSNGAKTLATLDQRIQSLIGNSTEPQLIDVADAVELLKLAYANIEFEDETDDDREAHIAALEHLARTCKKAAQKNKVWLLVARDRDVARYREEGRFSNAPDTKQQKDLARANAEDVPVLMLLRQNGDEAKGWRGLPFWWPVIMTPRSGSGVAGRTRCPR